MADSLTIETYTSQNWGQNAYIVRARSGDGVVVIDPGGEAPAMLASLGDAKLNAILLTHAHVDHIEGVASLARATHAPVYLHASDRPMYDRAGEQAALFGVAIDTPPAPDRGLAPGDPL